MNKIARSAIILLSATISTPMTSDKTHASSVQEISFSFTSPNVDDLMRSNDEVPNSTAVSRDKFAVSGYLQRIDLDERMGDSRSFPSVSTPPEILFDMADIFPDFVFSSEWSLADSPGVPSQVDGYIGSKTVGTALLEAAQNFQGYQYKPGMTCSTLIIAAIRQASMYMTTGNTTSAWFNKGLGSDFRQIYGGANGLRLGQLVDDLNNNIVDIPLGSIIVQDGHAAFYTGQIKIKDKWEIITYDANDQSGWTVMANGEFFRSDEPTPSGGNSAVMMRFPGRQVGEHVTRLQWSHDHLVKVFQPVADPPPEHPF